MVVAHVVEVLLFLVPRDAASLECRLARPIESRDDLCGQVALFEIFDEAVVASSRFGHFLDKLHIAARSYTKSMDGYEVLCLAGEFDHYVSIADLSVREYKDTYLFGALYADLG